LKKNAQNAAARKLSFGLYKQGQAMSLKQDFLNVKNAIIGGENIK